MYLIYYCPQTRQNISTDSEELHINILAILHIRERHNWATIGHQVINNHGETTMTTKSIHTNGTP